MFRSLHFTILLIILPSVAMAQSCDTLTWPVVVPVEYMNLYDLHGVKTYFFNAAKNNQKQEAIERLNKQYDTLTTVTIGHVIRREVVNNEDETYADSWFWWLVKETDKTYLNCYILSNALKGAPKKSYYELRFVGDTTTYRWDEPRYSPYNFSDVFLLLKGQMEVADVDNGGKKRSISPNQQLQNKIMNTPIYMLTKYNGYGTDNSPENTTFYRSLQFIFTEEESNLLLKTLQCMQ
ncbi:MAG: hypothetical protein R2800_15060 [Flavipsychrobacter sp.]